MINSRIVSYIKLAYSKQVIDNKKIGQGIEYTLPELSEWLLSQEKFHFVMETWRMSGYDNSMRPPLNRLQPHKHWTLENIKVEQWLYDGTPRMIEQLDEDGAVAGVYLSAILAAEDNNIHSVQTIYSECNYGSKFRYLSN